MKENIDRIYAEIFGTDNSSSMEELLNSITL